MKKTIFVFGGISSLVLLLFIVGFTVFNWGSAIVGYSAMIIAFSFIYVGIRNYREKYNGGTIGFGKALRIGLGIALIGSTAYVIAWMIDYNYFIPDFMDKYSAILIKQAHDSGVTGAALDKKIAGINQMAQLYKNPLMVVLFTYAEVLPVGIAISVLAALLLKRKTPRSVVPAMA
ncbi:DUF4199 domain-containing protein [Puia sp.]|jgi:hypothetical protein|uniref:DUF4199 domain-containing protein n=1 Tax=Puia sp. TaxID=2045100 RepID=UPI002F42A6C3